MKKFFVFLIFLVAILIGISYFWLHGVTQKIFLPNTNIASANPVSIQQDLDSKTSFNLLLLGYGGGNHDGAYLTDSMMVVHIDPKAEKIFLVSIPRDIWIKIPTNGTDGNYWKINAAYELGLNNTDYPNKQNQFKGKDGGGRLAEYSISQATGLPINYFVGMDFSGFTHTIDTLGGVNINVDPGFDDYSYPIEGKEDDTCGLSQDDIASLSAQIATGSATESDSFPCRFEHIHFDRGLQHMDGVTALEYVRSRHSLQDGTDFGRSNRQRNLLVAVKQKVFSAGVIPQIIPFMSSLGDDVRTDMSLDDVKTLIQNVSALNNYKIVSLALTDQNFLQDVVSSDGQAILEPRDGLDNWVSVHNWLTDAFSGKAQPVSAIVLIENGTNVAGLAQLAVNNLKDKNLQVLTPTNAPTHNLQRTTLTVYGDNVNQADLDILKREFGIDKIAYEASSDRSYNVLVIVGEDYNQKVGKKLLNE